jgi:hypothetical protein
LTGDAIAINQKSLVVNTYIYQSPIKTQIPTTSPPTMPLPGLSLPSKSRTTPKSKSTLQNSLSKMRITPTSPPSSSHSSTPRARGGDTSAQGLLRPHGISKDKESEQGLLALLKQERDRTVPRGRKEGDGAKRPVMGELEGEVSFREWMGRK